MTACAIEPSAAGEDDSAPVAGCTITVDGAYAARLAQQDGSCFPERWTLDGPEPYAVPLPGNQPEEPGTEVQPLRDGRVLIRRLVDGRHHFALLYPTGPGTGELPLGAVECPDEVTSLRLLPPAPGGTRAYALAVGPRSATVWLVAGGAFGPEPLAVVPGRCSGGVWLDRGGRMLALDRELGGRTKAVVVDLERGGEVSPLLQIAPDSDDRLLLADPDSGLILVGSDAPCPGQERLGWGVLGSTLPVRFPESLRVPGVPDCTVTPFAIQPGQVLTPESCGVALWIEGPLGGWVGAWRPGDRRMRHLPAPEGWLTGAGLWTRDGVLRLPYSTGEVPCGVAAVVVPWGETAGTTGEFGGPGDAGPGCPVRDGGASGGPSAAGGPSASRAQSAAGAPGASRAPGVAGGPAEPEPPAPVGDRSMPAVARPVPLQQAPLGRPLRPVSEGRPAEPVSWERPVRWVRLERRFQPPSPGQTLERSSLELPLRQGPPEPVVTN
ncbi:hypothetical protein ACFWIJ_39040 [Streptomyces sp. NPDC127079]|uniref:hypothetical protein n=1 Tax=Streptomyces sp. NPDC127079 TaxID=3347132 RepID=UPI0036494BC5